jgi:hypothetical protein
MTRLDGTNEGAVDGGTSTLQGGSILARHIVKDLVDIALFSDKITTKSPVVVATESEDGALVTIDILACQTIVALAAAIVVEASANAVANVEGGDS